MSQNYLLKTDLKIENDFLYKLGRSSQPNLNRIKSYPKTYEVILVRKCVNCVYIEGELLKLFNQKYNHALNREYFIGNENEMIMDINKFIDIPIPCEIIKEDKPLPFFECKLCNFHTSVKFNYDRHLTTNSHMKLKEQENSIPCKKLMNADVRKSKELEFKSKDMERKIISVQNNIDILMKKYNL
jgi:hypothetical protein